MEISFSLLLFVGAFVLPALLIGLAIFSRKTVRDLEIIPLISFLLILASLLAGVYELRAGRQDSGTWTIIYLNAATLGIFVLFIVQRILGVNKDVRRLREDPLFQPFNETAPLNADNTFLRRDDQDGDCQPTILLNVGEANYMTDVRYEGFINRYTYVLGVSFFVDQEGVEVVSVGVAYVRYWTTAAGDAEKRQVRARAQGKLKCLRDEEGNCILIPVANEDSDDHNELSAAATVNIQPVMVGGISTMNRQDMVNFKASGVAAIFGQLAIKKIQIGGKLGGSMTGASGATGSAELTGSTEIEVPQEAQATPKKSRSVVYQCIKASGDNDARSDRRQQLL